MPNTITQFPQRPRIQGSWWMVWYNLQWFASSIFDVFQNKFQTGSVTISNPATSALVTGLSVGSYQAIITPLGDPGAGVRWWVSGKTTSQFQINVSATPAVSLTFDWFIKGL